MYGTLSFLHVLILPAEYASMEAVSEKNPQCRALRRLYSVAGPDVW